MVAADYIRNLSEYPDFENRVVRNEYETFLISMENYAYFYQQKNIKDYREVREDREILFYNMTLPSRPSRISRSIKSFHFCIFSQTHEFVQVKLKIVENHIII